MLELEKALHKRCEEDPQYATLFAQWTFDKQLVGRALQSIPLVFPHYSLHDASHADTILRQMARVLGPNRIARLSPTDLWLLLEAAYHHDLGMVVDDQTMRAWWTDKKFDSFLDGLKTSSSDEEVQRAAELLDKRNDFKAQGAAWPFDVHRALVLVMAEYARPRHPGQSRKYIDAPSLLDLQSPRTQLVPRRFWSLLGRICESHGFGFAETMTLPARESGFSMDDAHPRFVACMLRLGDLLDLDDGRFCPVLARTFGGLPPSSKVHEEKHHAIHEFLVTPSEIRVLAECGTPEAFDVTEQWFSWLRQELQNQSVHWAQISPETDFGAVPSAGRIEARLDGYHTSPDGRRPRFEIDKEAMLDFVRGAGLYNDETACVAELLQNAVDATLLRVWGANRRKWQKLDEQRDSSALEKLREHLKKYPIDVRVEKSKRVGDENHWSVVIHDRGAGISKDDIKFLQCIGSSRKNPRRKERMRGMPEWMRPSGYFGIGLQSVFLFSDRIVLRSRADDSMETIEVELVQRGGGKEPQILVRSVNDECAMKRPGTRVQFVLREPKVPSRLRVSSSQEETERVLTGYDPILHDELPLLPSKVRDATRSFARNALAHVRLDGVIARDQEQSDGLDRFFDVESGVELALMAGRIGRIEFLYRGRTVDEQFGPPFFFGRADWHRGDASKLLTINREKLRIDAKGSVFDGIDGAIWRVLPCYYERVRSDPRRLEERRYVALAAHLDQRCQERKTIPPDDEWTKIEYGSSGITLGDIVATPCISLIVDPMWSAKIAGVRAREIEWSEDKQRMKISGHDFEWWLWELLRDRKPMLQSIELVSEIHSVKQWKYEWLMLSEEPDDVVKDEAVMKAVLLDAARSHRQRARRTIPCFRRFHAMALSADAESELRFIAHTHERLVPRAIFPFRLESAGKLSLEGAEELIKWTYKYRANKLTIECDIARAMLDLVQTADAWLRDEWGERVDYSIDELRRKLLKKYGPDVLPVRPGKV